METTSKKHIAHLVAYCAANGVKNVVISPGSRNAPLIIALDSHPDIKTWLIHDERSAAYFAIGLAEGLSEPVAITCTSGTAPLNYAPAIAEAYYRRVPLLVLTADRPEELIDQGDGQTIRQKEVFHNYIKADYSLPNDNGGDLTATSDRVVESALVSLNSNPKGPIHLNIPLAEPLYETSEDSFQAREISPDQNIAGPANDKLESLLSKWQSADKKMVLIGQNDGDYKVSPGLQKLIDDPTVAVVVENTSNVVDFKNVCHCIDRSLAAIGEDDSYVPDLLITTGGAIISKRIKALFRKLKPREHWRFGEYHFDEDTFGALTETFNCPEQPLFNVLASQESSGSMFGAKWKQLDFQLELKQEDYLQSAPFSEMKAFEIVLGALPENSDLHMANSSVVRYCQLFNPISSIRYYSNRGVSGIDGSTSTALGMANSSDRLMTLITGDISFFYDSNALWNSYLKSNLRIVLINNGGGGIFKYIPGPSDSQQIDYFVAEHSGDAAKLCAAFGVDYLKASNESELADSFSNFYAIRDENRPILLEIDTSGINNEDILKDYFKSLV